MKLFKFFLLFLSLCGYSQNNLMRVYPQVQPATTTGFYYSSDFSRILKTSDGGYLLSAYPYTPNTHGPLPFDFISIKTNSVFVSSWKQTRFVKSVVLPTGRIITVNKSWNSDFSEISKITNSGATVWTKILTDPTATTSAQININDIISYNNKILCVGQYVWTNPLNTAQPNGYKGFICELDTLGNITNQKIYDETIHTQPYTLDILFNKIVRDANGDFIIGGANSIHKFNSTFNNVWSLYNDTLKYKFTDIHILANGDLFCLLSNFSSNSLDTNSVLLKLNSLGNIIFSKKILLNARYGGMEKTSTGNFAISALSDFIVNDSTKSIILVVDSNANFVWARKQLPSIGISKPLCINNQLLYASYYKNLMIQSCDLNGNSACLNFPFNIIIQNASLSFDNFFGFSLITSSMSLVSGNTYTSVAQIYHDTCGGFPFSIEEHSKQNIKIWPNPTTGKLIIQSDEDLTGYSIKITSVEGKLVKDLMFETKDIDLTFLDPGIFFLFFLKDGYLIETKKLITSR